MLKKVKEQYLHTRMARGSVYDSVTHIGLGLV